MGGSSKQTIGYKYFGGMMLAIGNRIEKLIDINPDERGWIMTPQNKKDLSVGNASTAILKTDIFGGDNQEGGMGGILDVYTGSQIEPSEYLKRQINEDISAYPNLSYLVFRGVKKNSLEPSLDRGFYWCSMSGMLKDMMLWVKRIHVKNDGSIQWYDQKSEIDSYRYETFPRFMCEDGKKLPIESTYYFYNDSTNYGFEDATYNSPITGEIKWSEADRAFSPNYIVINPARSFTYGAPNGTVKLDSTTRIKKIGDGTIRLTLNLSINKKDSSFSLSGASIIDQHLTGSNEAYSSYLIKAIWSGNSDIVISTNSDGFSTSQEGEFSTGVYATISLEALEGEHIAEVIGMDINPIHKIREILTDNEAMGKDESRINDLNFTEAADRIFDESLGISWSISEKSCKEALDELLYHIEGGIRINRSSGKYEIVLFRDDLLDIENSIKFNESNIKSIEFDISNLEDSISSINVSYYDRELIKDSSFLLYENGLERTRGYSISENVDFPYFMYRKNAEIVGNWKLKQLSTPTLKGSLKTGIEQAREINKYDVILLSWSSKNIVNLPVRIMNINLGDGINNTVTFDFVEVIPYSNISYSDTSVDEKVDDRLPPQINLNTAFEMPYFESVQRFGQSQVDLELSSNPEIGYLMASAAKPQNNSLNAQLYTDRATGLYENLTKVGVVDYCPALYIDQNIGFTESVFKVKDINSVSVNGVSRFTGATSGTWIILNNEIMVYESFDAELMQITVKRGALDTVPHKHTSGAIFFSDEFSGFDNNQYVQSEIVKSQVLTSTPSDLQEISSGNTKEVEFNSRAIRPYPPANVKINNIYYPDNIIISSDIYLSWVYRNRVQQTGGNIIGFYDDGVTTEPNVTYSIELIVDNAVIYSQYNITINSHSIPASSLIPNKVHKIKMWSVRDGFESYQSFEHSIFIESVSLILTATAYKDKVVGSTVPAASINVVVDESLSANMQYDGSKISGKTLPNSQITIEIED